MHQESNKYKILILGGSGFISGTLAARAIEQGHEVWVVTRGNNPIPKGVKSIKADRHNNEAFKKSIIKAKTKWDAVFDCICMKPEDAKQDIDVFKELTQHMIILSTDFVYEPSKIKFPQGEACEHYVSGGYGGNKRLCELEFLSADTGDMAWTVLRISHVFGPGSKLGSFPAHTRDEHLIENMLAGQPISLVGGGHFLQQPTFVADLAELMINCIGNVKTYNQIFCAHGPEVIEAKRYFEIIAAILNVKLTIKDIPFDPYLAEHPEHKPFLCNRIYDLTKLKNTGIKMPSTTVEEGLRIHVESLRGRL